MPIRVEYTPRWPFTTTDLERDRDNPLRLGLYRDGAIVNPTSGTVTLYNAGNTLVATETVAAVGNYATVTIDAADLTTQSIGTGWRIEWSLVMPDTLTHVYRHPAALCRVLLPPAAAPEHLLGLHADLDEYLPIDPATNVRQTSWQPQLDTAWRFVRAWIERRGRRPFLITSSGDLEQLHSYEAMAIIAANIGGDGNETSRWGRLGARYERLAQQQRDTLTLAYDEDDTGAAVTGRRVAATPPILLTSRGTRAGWLR